MRIHYTFQSTTKTFDRDASQVIVGRPKPGVEVDLDLTPDDTVSRPHARLWMEDGSWWIEDLRSSHGTKVNDREIRYSGKTALRAGDVVDIGVTRLVIELPAPAAKPATLPGIEIAAMQDAAAGGAKALALDSGGSNFVARLKVLCELPLQISSDLPLDELFEVVLDRLVAVIPGAIRAAVLLVDTPSGELLPRAFRAPGGAGPAVSETLARRSIGERKGLLWLRGWEGDMTHSILVNRIESGMYAPLLWGEQAFGVICVDNPKAGQPFSDDDLRFLVAVAQYTAIAVANYRLAEDLRRTVLIQERLLTSFSPKLRQKLLDRARHGRLRTGGERSEVTILSCDMRGFTRTAAAMDPEDVVDMLNEYLPALTAPILQQEGTVDKFIGDAVLAVFGSPEPDAQQCEKAVRAALAMQTAAELLSDARRRRNQPTCRVGIGIHCGDVVHGFVGSQERMEFTVVGDAVNRASRYCDAAQGGEVLISPDVFRHVHRVFNTLEKDVVAKHDEKLRAYLVTGIKGRQTVA